MRLADPRDLDALLGQIQFRPRASLQGEVAGRWARGDRPTPGPRPVGNKLVWLGLMLLLLGGVLYLVQSEFGLAQVRTVDRCCEDFDGGGNRDDDVEGSLIHKPSLLESKLLNTDCSTWKGADFRKPRLLHSTKSTRQHHCG